MPEPKTPARTPANKPAAAAPAPGDRSGWLSWFVGWVLLPGTIVGVIFGGGVLLGAHRPSGWFARSVVWLVELF